MAKTVGYIPFLHFGWSDFITLVIRASYMIALVYSLWGNILGYLPRDNLC